MTVKTVRQLCAAAFLFIAGVTICAGGVTGAAIPDAIRKPDSDGAIHLWHVQTDSPRQTFQTFLNIARELDQIVTKVGLDRASDDQIAYKQTLILIEQAVSLIDLSMLPEGTRREIGSSTVACLLDIFGRIDPPDVELIPDIDDDMPIYWRVPDSPIRIVKMSEGQETTNTYLLQAPIEMPRYSISVSVTCLSDLNQK